MLTNLDKAPFPWFGGKRHAAPLIWERLGDVAHYVEPFGGSLAVLLCRPALANRPYHSETVNDLDGLLVNAWRAIALSPEATAEAASWPVSECDLHARHASLVRWSWDVGDGGSLSDHLCGDPVWHDPEMAGWWIWGQSCWIGGGWCSGRGPWVVDERGCLVRRTGPGVKRQLPDLHSDGQGVNHPGAREPGVDDGVGFHSMTMPEIRRWFRFLSARLRHARILCGDWRRLVSHGATITLSVDRERPCGVLLDPPYGAAAGRDTDLYARDSATVAGDARAWCIDHGNDPLYRIALCGFEDEGHEELVGLGWTEEEWYTPGFLRGGMGNIGGSSQQRRERIWFSPHCLRGTTQQSLFTEDR